MDDQKLKNQSKLIATALNALSNQENLALKGGIAINYFYRDFPRYSVDLDLTYLPLQTRLDTLNGIADSLQRVKDDLKLQDSSISVTPITLPETQFPTSLTLKKGHDDIRLEVNYILRGSVYPNQSRKIAKAAGEELGTAIELSTLSFEDTYAGKLCAALGRQHPRDFFDVKLLLENEGITPQLKTAFLVYLASGNRPFHELLSPSPVDMAEKFANNFIGLNRIPVTLNELVETRRHLITEVHKALNDKDREFLISVSNSAPKWELLDVPHAKDLPGIRWKLMNLEKMDKDKRKLQTKQLEQILSGKQKTNGIER